MKIVLNVGIVRIVSGWSRANTVMVLKTVGDAVCAGSVTSVNNARTAIRVVVARIAETVCGATTVNGVEIVHIVVNFVQRRVCVLEASLKKACNGFLGGSVFCCLGQIAPERGDE